MQEGTLAFLSMVKITAAVRAHRQAKIPCLVYLRHPTTGGVWAESAAVRVALCLSNGKNHPSFSACFMRY